MHLVFNPDWKCLVCSCLLHWKGILMREASQQEESWELVAWSPLCDTLWGRWERSGVCHHGLLFSVVSRSSPHLKPERSFSPPTCSRPTSDVFKEKFLGNSGGFSVLFKNKLPVHDPLAWTALLAVSLEWERQVEDTLLAAIECRLPGSKGIRNFPVCAEALLPRWRLSRECCVLWIHTQTRSVLRHILPLRTAETPAAHTAETPVVNS